MIPPFRKGGDGGIFRLPRKVRELKIPLNPPLEKGETQNKKLST